MEEEKKKTDKLPSGKKRKGDSNRLTGGSVTPRKKFFFPQLLLLAIFILKVSYLKGHLLELELELAAEKGGIRSKSREDDRG